MKTRAARPVLLLAALIMGVQGAALAQTDPTLRVVRDDATMVLTNRGDAEDGARSLLSLAGCEEGVRTTVFYGPPDAVEMTIDDESRLQASLAVIKRPDGNGQAADGETEGQETIEMLDGDVVFAGRPACIESFEPAAEPRVILEQGRTRVQGVRFFLDRETDVATMDGPIELEREAAAGSEALSASAEALAYDLETKRSTLSGGVEVVSGDRVSEAETLELDEEAGLATLVGSPARSRRGEDVIEGERLLYYLDSNDVVVIGGVKGTLEVDLE